MEDDTSQPAEAVTIGARIRAVRKGEPHALSQSAFAEMFGIDAGTVARWERGAHEPSMQVLMKIAGHFGVKLDWLLAGDGDRPDWAWVEKPKKDAA